MFLKILSCAALASLLASSAFAAAEFQQNPVAVTIKAFDSRGKDTGKCIRGPDTLTEGPGGWRLAKCDPKAANQKLLFDVNTGGWIYQWTGASQIAMGVRGGATGDGFFASGVVVDRVTPSRDPNFANWAVKWRWVGKQIRSLDAAAAPNSWCLSALQSKGDAIVVEPCADTARLPQWDVLVVK